MTLFPKFIHRAALAVLVLAQSACANAGFQVVNMPTHFSNIEVVRDVVFDEAHGLKLDIYLPPKTIKGPYDTAVFFYGGRWDNGTKNNYGFVGDALARRGFIVVIPDYRKYPEVRFPSFVQDGAKAVAWVYDHAGTYGGQQDRIHLTGHSAGAHIAGLIASDKRYLAAEGKDRAAVVRSFVGLAGPYDFVPEEEEFKIIFGPPENYSQMQAPTFIDGTQPPMLLMQGAEDKDVNISNLEKLEAAIHAKGGCVQRLVYPKFDHVDIIAAVSWIGPSKPDVLGDMARFMKNVDDGKACNALPSSD